MEYEVQRLELGDIVLVSLPGEDEEVEATVIRHTRSHHNDRPGNDASARTEQLHPRVGRSARW